MVSIQGTVESKSAGSDTWQEARVDGIYCQGDAVRVGENGRAALVLANDTLLRLDQNSAITLTAVSHDQRSLLEVVRGWLHFISRVPHSLQVNTPYVNAAIEGTEFVVAVNEAEASVTVFEGRVLASNAAGEVRITHNETAAATANSPPQKVLRARPRDAVQWALYYPPILPAGDPLAPAADLLYHGRVEEARRAMQDVAATAEQGKVKALEAIIAVVNNDNERALQLATEAVAVQPDIAATHIALSYAQQARFELDAALTEAEKAVEADACNALAHARLAELLLSVGRLEDALQMARRATQIDKKQGRAQTILGFAHLTQLRIADAMAVFTTAIALDPVDPLPHLGLGLAKIRKNQLAEGRREIEIAALLDPNNSLIRSYLGKAYFEEKRSPLDADQFAMAKELDPNDPTPWFYDAIDQQQSGRPVQAMENMRRSIELNDSRAIYRSRLLLDEDLAARNVGQARIFEDLSYSRLALVESYRSVTNDPANFSSHRFLADSYASQPRHEIAQVSELLQSQLLQPIDAMPLQPQFAQTDLSIVRNSGPTNLSSQEFNQLFTREGFSFYANGMAGRNDTRGDDAALRVLKNNIAAAVGQYHFATDGIRPNNDLSQDVYDFFAQSVVSQNLSYQVDVRHERTDAGDVVEFANQYNRPYLRNTIDQDSARIGLHFKPSVSRDWLVSAIASEISSVVTDLSPAPPPLPFFKRKEITGDFVSRGLEMQYIGKEESYSSIFGIGYAAIDADSNLTVDVIRDGVTQSQYPIVNVPSREEIKQYNTYLYFPWEPFSSTRVTLGGSYDYFDKDQDIEKQVNPKFGMEWTPSQFFTLRVASFRTFKRTIVTNQTVEPTQVAGFNQFYDDVERTDAVRRGIAADYRILANLNTGIESSWRKLNFPFTSNGAEEKQEIDEVTHIAYIYWALAKPLSVSTEYHVERMDRDYTEGHEDLSYPKAMNTIRIPVTFSYHDGSGWLTSLTSNYVKQKVQFVGETGLDDVGDKFNVLDASIGYHVPRFPGLLSIEVRNILDKNFRYQSVFNTSKPRISDFQPQRTIVMKISMSI